jgi:uncharacterized membrane protein YtjA (UPF0391 family)
LRGLAAREVLRRADVMLFWAAVFLLLAMAAAIPGFTGIARAFAAIATIQFLAFLAPFLTSLASHANRRTWNSPGARHL